MIKKRGLKIFIFGILLVFLINSISALGISPAIKSYNFQPGLEDSIVFSISGDDPSTELEIYVEGDLQNSFSLDKTKMVGSGEVTVNFKLPSSIERPGKHRVYVGAREIIDPELYGSAIGTSVTIQAVIVINVPYPGRYVELHLQASDANVGENVEFILEIANKGKEDLNLTPMIDIGFENNSLEKLNFSERFLASGDVINLQKFLNTTKYKAGTYTARAIVDYGSISSVETDFRIGELVINIINYTKEIILEGVKNFDIQVESGWNGKIDGAYANVIFLNDSNKNIETFQTSSTNLDSWGQETIRGYFDTSKFSSGIYNANITLIYYGKDVGVSSSEVVPVIFLEAKKSWISENLVLISIALGILALIVAFFVGRYFAKNEKKK